MAEEKLGCNLMIVDDEHAALNNLEKVFTKQGCNVYSFDKGEDAITELRHSQIDVVLTDLRMKGIDGFEVLKQSKKISPDTEVIVVTGYATPETAVSAMQLGAFYYVAKPFRLDEVKKVVREAYIKVKLKRENQILKNEIETYKGKVNIITQNEDMQLLLKTARQVAVSDCSILICGESGTGKELLARYLHNHSLKAEGPFLGINCGAFTEELLANELFGHEKGAYTGASQLKRGLIETANKGTLLLDEVTEMPQSMQVNLLRVLQEHELLRLGGTRPVKIDVRFFATTNRDPKTLISSGALRQDLYYRLNVVTFELPSLRNRKDDVVLLANHFLDRHAAINNQPRKTMTDDVIKFLQHYSFPGNVRELENIIERGVALAVDQKIGIEHLPVLVTQLIQNKIPEFKQLTELPTLKQQEKNYIEFVLEKTNGNKTAAANILGIDRVSLWRRIKNLALDTD